MYRACVASPHRLASQAGLDVLREGGNAFDAALATNLTLGVVAPYLCGYGGDVFAMVWDGVALHGYDGSGRAPAAATLEAARAASGAAEQPSRGPHSVTVPGAVRGWFDLHERFGSLPLERLAAPALAAARDGFVLSDAGARAIAASVALFAHEAAFVAAYGDARAGEVLPQPGLARTIQTLIAEGPAAYYEGEIASAIAACLRERGALMHADDLAGHYGDWVAPLSLRYRDTEVVELPPSSQGVVALEALGIVGEAPPPGPEREHRLIEACKLALSDRDRFVTDAAHMTIDPSELLAPAHLADRRARIDPARAGAPRTGIAPDGGTAYLCAADEAGMMVSMIQSNYAGFGSGVTVPGWGINLHSRGAFFRYDPAHVNVIAPAKRTMHTLMPAMAMREGVPWLAFGSMGGNGQAQNHVQMLVRLVDDGAGVADAVSAPRWLVGVGDWSVAVESRCDAAVVDALRERGHEVSVVGAYESLMGHAHAIAVRPGGGYEAASDPRSPGAALGW